MNITSKTFGVIVLIVICTIMFNPLAYGADFEEGGYVGTEKRHIGYVWNFLKHFNYQQYYYAYIGEFINHNNDYVDAMDFAYFAGHGNYWTIETSDGCLSLMTAGYSSHKGYGDKDLEFIVFHSCKVIPGPRDVKDWWSPWVKSGGIFDGLHQALGFRTNCCWLSGPNIASYFGYRMKKDDRCRVWRTWLNAIKYKGIHFIFYNECGSAVMHPDAEYDKYSKVCPDPPENHQNLMIWYQY